MFWKLVSLFIGSRWRTFCGLSRGEFVETVTAAADDLGYRYELEEMTATRGERKLLGAEEGGKRLTVSEPVPFDVTVITATIDPITSFALSVFVTEEKRDELTSDLCIVTVSPVTDETRGEIARLVTAVVEASETPPWKLTHHVKFRLAVLLRVKVRLLWKYWLRVAKPGR